MQLLFALAAAVLGGILEGTSGMLFGALVGYGYLYLWQQVRDLKQQVDTQPGLPAAETTSPPLRTPTGIAAETESVPAAGAPPDPSDTRSASTGSGNSEWESIARASAEPSAVAEASAFETKIRDLWLRVASFFMTGNPVVRIGAVVLFFGVAFLLRYAYENSLVPVELRLAGASLGGIALTIVGWRLRGRSDTYGLILQGAGVGLLYLTIFASARLYELIPMTAAFALLVVLVAASCALAVLQKSQALAVFAMSGGFLAPVLTSTGSGSHVALFSYYALLNGGILVMAWFQFWRWLNWTGFVFTFAIGAIWGYQYYQPEHFATTEPFLILFFLYYLGVSLLFARRKEVHLRGLIDGTLVFGLPIIAFALQAALVSDMEFGLALSALGAALTYTALALWLKRQGAYSDLLGQSFVALGVIFATLAIPFAFDNQRFTAATWALEGAGIVWVGIRQQQLLPRLFGMLLQLAAAFAYLAEAGTQTEPVLFLNSAYFGTVILSLSALFTAYIIAGNSDQLRRFERPLRWFFLAWGVAWWLFGGVLELGNYRPGGTSTGADNLNEHLMLLFVGLSFATLATVAGRTHFKEALLPGFLLLPIAGLGLLGLDLGWTQSTVFTDLGWLAWPVVVAAIVFHLRHTDSMRRLSSVWLIGSWWFVTLLVTWNAVALVWGFLPHSVWAHVLWGGVPLASAAMVLSLRDTDVWPLRQYANAFFGWGLTSAVGYLIAWTLVSGIEQGDPAPLPYLVLLNPLELVQLAVLGFGAFWLRSLKEGTLASYQPGVASVLGVSGFLWLNFVAARAVHFYAGVAYPLEHIVDSDVFRTTASILWTLVAFTLMGFGTRRMVRWSWLIGAMLLGGVILKLFFIDLGRMDMVARIISFISVGVLMLVIGYFSPVPPKKSEEVAV